MIPHLQNHCQTSLHDQTKTTHFHFVWPGSAVSRYIHIVVLEDFPAMRIF